MIKYCGVALCALAAVLVLRGAKSEFAVYVGIAVSVILLGGAVTTLIPVLEYADGLISETGFGVYLKAIVKALGITLAIQFASDVCRDSGESAIASKLELIGKAEILLLCLPLIRELISLAKELMEI